MLAYLALYGNRPHPREELIALFWPDADTEQGRTSLRTALASLRRQLEPSGVEAGAVLLADRQSVRLRPEAFTTDVAEFEKLIAQSRSGEPSAQIECLRRAAALYRGDLLPGYYDEWAAQERERLSEARFDALRRLSEALEARGEYAPAVEFARRVVQANPLDEAAHATLIRLYIAQQKPSAAQRQYQELERILREELDVAPSPDVQALLQSLHTGAPDAVEPPLLPSRAAALPKEPGGTESAPTPPTPVIPLPTPLTSFLGREAELAQIGVLLESPETRLVTLTGLGGIGKTRLALEIARRAQETGQRVYFVPLADIALPHLVGEAIRTALRLEATGLGDPLEQVMEPLSEAPALLILDNFEQVVEAGRPLVQRLLQRCPHLTCLITSRIPLGLSGEWEFPVMALPIPTAPGTPDHLLAFAGVHLFVNRAAAVRPGFGITLENAQAIAQLCGYLEGIPLAIELAAARAQVLTPAQMLQQMTNRFRFLAARQKDIAERHRTLRAALEWSYQALDAGHRRLLAWLSVFRGGWDLAALEAIYPESAALDLLMDLRDASLLITAEQGGEMRFRMLETVREYAGEKLWESGEALAAQQCHRDYYLRLAQTARPQLSGPEQTAWLARLEAEHDNFRAALDCCAREAEGGEAGLQLVAALLGFWDVRGYFAEGQERCKTALAHPGAQAPTKARAAALGAAGSLNNVRGDFAAARAA